MLALMDKGTIAIGAITFYVVLCSTIYFVVRIFPKWDARQRARRSGGSSEPEE